jgi:hypothetical protein
MKYFVVFFAFEKTFETQTMGIEIQISSHQTKQQGANLLNPRD